MKKRLFGILSILAMVASPSPAHAFMHGGGSAGAAPGSSGYSTDVLAHAGIGLLNYYRLGNASSPFLDSGNSNSAAVTGGVTFASAALLPGDTTKAPLFDGSTGYATLSSSSDWNFNSTSNFSFDALIKPVSAGSPGSKQAIACRQLNSGTHQGWCFQLDNVSGTLFLEVVLHDASTNVDDVIGSQAISINAAHHVSFSHASGSGVVSPYFNYQLEVDATVDTHFTFASRTVGSNSIQGAASSTIGSRNGADEFFNGYIQELADYNSDQSFTTFAAQLYNHADIFLGALPLPAISGTPTVILDSDLSTDIGDEGAVAVLAQLTVNGEDTIACEINDTSGAHNVVAQRIITEYKGVHGLTYGAYKQTGMKADTSISQGLVTNFGATYAGGSTDNWANYTDATLVYRSCLNSAANNSITLIMIGQWNAFYNLLQSGADCSGCPGGVTDAINQTGAQLVASKIKKVVFEGGNFSSSPWYAGALGGGNGPGPAFNLFFGTASCPSSGASSFCSSTAIAALLADNIEVAFVGDEQGAQVVDGPGSSHSTSTDPIAWAYNAFCGTPTCTRFAWDEITVLAAVRGFGPASAVSPGTNFESWFLNGGITITPSTGDNTQIGPTAGSANAFAITAGHVGSLQSTVVSLMDP